MHELAAEIQRQEPGGPEASWCQLPELQPKLDNMFHLAVTGAGGSPA